jgi:hypothetical protein
MSRSSPRTTKTDYTTTSRKQTHKGEPYFISEYGGIKWAANESDGWATATARRLKRNLLTLQGADRRAFRQRKLFGFCYTQLYDVEQEVNGLMTYDRKFKFAPEIFRK